MSGPDWDEVARRIDVERMRLSLVHWMTGVQIVAVVLILATFFILAGCATGIAPEKPVVTSVTSLPAAEIPIPVRCVKEIPPIPDVKIDVPDPAVPSSFRRTYFQMKEQLLSWEAYIIETRGLLIACADPPVKK